MCMHNSMVCVCVWCVCVYGVCVCVCVCVCDEMIVSLYVCVSMHQVRVCGSGSAY